MVPGATAVTVPFESTVATALLLVANVTDDAPVTLIVSLFPAFSLMLVGWE